MKILPGIFVCSAVVLVASAAGGAVREYTAAEAAKHIGEKATVVGKVGCVDAGRTFHCLPLDGCLGNSPFWIIVNDDASGPDLNVHDLKGVTIAVTGKIEKPQTQPWLVVKSTTQIQVRSALNIDHISHAYEKEANGDVEGATAEFGQAIEQQPDRRKEAYEQLARLKKRKGDWTAALEMYDKMVAADPNNGDSYYVRAKAKQQHDDFEGAMADYSRAAEIRSSGPGYTEVGNFRKAHGDTAGAIASYDQAIALLDRKIAEGPKGERQQLMDRPDSLYYQRGYAKELKGDLDGAESDYTQAIALKPTYAAGAYSRRGDIKNSRGDLAGAIADYQHAVQYAQLPEDKEKLKNAKPEASRNHEQSFNKSEVTPESVAAAFVQAYSGADAEAVAGLYADRVDYTNNGVISNAAVRAQAKEYFTRWPVRQWSLVGPVKATVMGPSREQVTFSATYDASSPQTNKRASGIAKETLILATDPSGAMKIVSQKEQTSKRGSSQADEKTSGDFGLKAAKTEYDTSSHDEAARVRYVTKLAGMLGKGMQYWWSTHDKMGGPNLDGVEEELIKHPMPRNVDSRKLTQLLIGKWASPRHVYVFRADGTYGVADEQRDKWRIDGNEYIDDVSRGPIILLDRNYFIYAEGQGVAFYMQHKDPIKSDKSSDVALEQRIVGYWKFPKVAFHIAADGKMYGCPRKAGDDIDEWDVRDGKFYWSGVEYKIVTLTDNKFVYQETGNNPQTFTLIRSTKEEADPQQ